MYLDCPKCGHINEEAEYEELHYDCEMCQTSYDMAVCDYCGEIVGTYFGDGDECDHCGHPLTIESIAI